MVVYYFQGDDGHPLHEYIEVCASREPHQYNSWHYIEHNN